MKKYVHHIDSGHGWLEVPYREMRIAGLDMSQISSFSYAHVNDQYVPTLYLEEDCDMPLFLNALNANGVDFELVEQHHDGDAFIRELGRV